MQRAASCAGLTAAACAGLLCCWTMHESVLLAYAIGWLSADHSLGLLTANARRQVSSTHHASCQLQQASRRTRAARRLRPPSNRLQTHVHSCRTTSISDRGCRGYCSAASTCARCLPYARTLPHTASSSSSSHSRPRRSAAAALAAATCRFCHCCCNMVLMSAVLGTLGSVPEACCPHGAPVV